MGEEVSVVAKLTEKQKLFVQEYLVDLNATQAANRAGYKNPEIGRQLITKNNVSAAISEAMQDRAERVEITQDRILRELAAVAFADASTYAQVVDKKVKDFAGKDVTIRAVEVLPTEKLTPKQRAALAGIKEGKNGIEVKLNDKMQALELLGRHLGMFTDRVIVSAPSKDLAEKIEKLVLGDGAE